MSKIYVGIDIGKLGAIVTMYPDKIFSQPMPLIKKELDYQMIAAYLKALHEAHPIHVCFEKLGLIFKSSKQVAWSMGEQSGAIEMACIALNIPYTKVRAVDWQKAMFVGVPEITKTGKTTRDTKAMALIAVKRLFPNETLTFKANTKEKDGLIDALLLAEYARRNNF